MSIFYYLVNTRVRVTYLLSLTQSRIVSALHCNNGLIQCRRYICQLNACEHPPLPTTTMMSSILRLARTQSKRLPTTVSAPSRLLSTTTQRALAATPLRRAAPSWLPPLFSSAAYEALQLSSVFQKLKDNPDALAAVVRFSEVMQSQGTSQSFSIIGVLKPRVRVSAPDPEALLTLGWL